MIATAEVSPAVERFVELKVCGPQEKWAADRTEPVPFIGGHVLAEVGVGQGFQGRVYFRSSRAQYINW